MILRWKLCLAIMVATSTLVVSGLAAAQEITPPSDDDPEPPSGFGVPNGVGEPKGEPKGAVPKGEPKGAVPKGEPPDREPPNNEKKLLEAGGDLSPPQQSVTENDSSNDSRFPLWRVAGMIASAGLFLWAGYRVISRG